MTQLPRKAPQFYTVAEVAELTRVSRMTVYRMVHAGDAMLGVEDDDAARAVGE